MEALHKTLKAAAALEVTAFFLSGCIAGQLDEGATDESTRYLGAFLDLVVARAGESFATFERGYFPDGDALETVLLNGLIGADLIWEYAPSLRGMTSRPSRRGVGPATRARPRRQPAKNR